MGPARRTAKTGRVPTPDEVREEVLRPLAVGDAGERAVLPFDKHPGVDEDVQEEAGLQRKLLGHELVYRGMLSR